MGRSLEFIRGRGWRISAAIVGALALFVGIWATAAFGAESLWPGPAVAVGFIAVATVMLIPPSTPRRRATSPRRDR